MTDPYGAEFVITDAEGRTVAVVQVKHDPEMNVSHLLRRFWELAKNEGYQVSDVSTDDRESAIVRDIESDPNLPDDLKWQLLTGYRELRRNAQEAARKRNRDSS